MENAFEELAGLQVVVEKVVYMPDLEAPPERPHPFVYFLNIQNESSEWVQIMGRKWVVREKSDDEMVVVEGDGVVGQTPELAPGECFSYNSYHIARGNARAEGAFFGRTEDGKRIMVRIPAFELVVPEAGAQQ